jgi:tetratricopeptide (TPR) repeat protein
MTRKDPAALEQLAQEDGVFSQPPADLVLLSSALNAMGAYAAAERLLRRGQQLHPADFWTNACLAYRLVFANEPSARTESAVGNRIIRVDASGRIEEGIGFFRAALASRPRSPAVYTSLGVALWSRGKLAEAEAAFRKAVALKPDFFVAHNGLGNALGPQGKVAEAEAAFRKAIALNPDFPEAHGHLGVVLYSQGKVAEAEAAFRRAIALEPGFPEPYLHLGAALRVQGKLAEAEDACRKAIALRPDFALGHCNLGAVLTDQGRFVEALAALKRGHALGSQNPHWPHPSAQWVQQCKRFIQLDCKLPAILSGREQPADAAERIGLAELCQLPCKKRYATAARFYGEAFAAEPERAGDQPSQGRYNGACAAALAGCGQGEDAGTLDTTARAGLRQQALDWLRAELAAWHKLLKEDRSKAAPAVGKQMQHWLRDADFAGVRRPQALAELPEAERSAWEKLWAEVEQLLAQAEGKGPGPEK